VESRTALARRLDQPDRPSHRRTPGPDGSDWLCFDLQHGLLSHSHLLALLPIVAATDKSPLVRVCRNDAGDIGRALDAGAHGVIVPMINSAAEAAAAAAACRYPPAGRRSCGPLRGVLRDGLQYLATANDEVACIAMIETREGLEDVEAIAATPGIDALFIGPVDLCYGLGVRPGDFGNPQYVSAVQRIKAACAAAGRAVGIYGYSPELARQALGDGFAFASVGSDVGFFRDGAQAALRAACGTAPTTSTAASVSY
jgi:4-hydroxy-2-oxoheptanedioate aldolase